MKNNIYEGRGKYKIIDSVHGHPIVQFKNGMVSVIFSDKDCKMIKEINKNE